MRSSKPAVVLVGHGSKSRGFAAAMERVASSLRKTKRYREVLCAFLEVSAPSIPEAVDLCVRRGASEVRVLPYFVLTGKHVLHDIPGIVQEISVRHSSKAKIILCPYLGYHSAIVSVVRQRIREGRP